MRSATLVLPHTYYRMPILPRRFSRTSCPSDRPTGELLVSSFSPPAVPGLGVLGARVLFSCGPDVALHGSGFAARTRTGDW